MKALYSIDSILENSDNMNYFIENFTINIPYNYVNSNGDTVSDIYECKGLNVWSYMDYEYSLFQFAAPASISDNLELRNALYRIWDIYVNDDVLVNMPRILTAFMSEYNPLENYNSIEDTTGSGKSRSHTGGKVKTNTKLSNNITSDGETKHYETTYDNTINEKLRYRDAVKTPSTETSGSADTNFTDYGALSVNTDGTINVDNNHLINATDASNEQKITKHGNIGVTTSQQMIEAEMKLRKFNIIKYIVDRFADQYLTLSR